MCSQALLPEALINMILFITRAAEVQADIIIPHFQPPSGRVGPKETNAMGPNLYRPKLASEEETKILFMSRA